MLKEGMKTTRGQVTIFIIIAILIVAVAVLVYFFFPQIQGIFGLTPTSPQGFIQNCLEQDVNDAIDKIASQGGSLNPELYFMYKGDKIQYACYNQENYLPCIVQQPMLKSKTESEIKRAIQSKATECFNELVSEYQGKGYNVQLGPGDFNVELLPKRVVITFERTLSLTKGESVERLTEFRVILHNNLYELISIANSIINWEARYGDAETTGYMNYYHDLKVEKYKQTGGTTVYILTDRNDNSMFQFASRSVAWPPGYSL